MQFEARLQRFDDAGVLVAEGILLDQVVAAATAIYTALIPQLIPRGHTFIRDRMGDASSGEYLDRNQVEDCLRAQEYGVAVYELVKRPTHQSPDAEYETVPKLVFWLGANREDPPQ